jgi:hypothetical protein
MGKPVRFTIPTVKGRLVKGIYLKERVLLYIDLLEEYDEN